MYRSVLVGAAVAVFVAGCATQVAGLKKSPTFTYPSIAKGKMAVGGVASASGTMDEGKRSSYANLLRTALMEERKEYNIAPVGVVINKLGSQYNTVINELQTTGSLSDKSVALLKAKVPDVRYVSFARIENDEVNSDRNERSETDKDGKTIPNSQKVITTSQRAVTASLNIYDLQTGEVVWTGSVTKSLSNSHQFDKEKENDLVSVIKAIKGDNISTSVDQKYPFPTPPDSSKVLSRVFVGFGENLPEKD